MEDICFVLYLRGGQLTKAKMTKIKKLVKDLGVENFTAVFDNKFIEHQKNFIDASGW